jgi:hypothetical protein
VIWSLTKDHAAVLEDLYGAPGVSIAVGTYPEFQRLCAGRYSKPLLNAACGMDPCRLGELFGAINLDAFDPDEEVPKRRSRVPNFVKGSVFALPYPDEHFPTIILGEFIEHATFDAAVRALVGCRRVLTANGVLVLTFPVDGTPLDQQPHFDPPQDCGFHEDGDVSGRHQTFWSVLMLHELFKAAKLIVLERSALFYPWVNPTAGWGIVLRKDQRA